MRILVLQLARFGDIYQSWPALKALRRLNPEAELHILVRESFKAAIVGFDGIHVHCLPTAEILAPMIGAGDEKQSLRSLGKFVQPLCDLEFDKIINLSFSPVSSYLTDILTHEHSEVRGYSRFSDGYLKIADDSSAYFYAQGEIGKHNRFHITQLFASVAGVDLVEEDYQHHSGRGISERKNQVIVHLGASQAARIYPAEQWIDAISIMVNASDANFILIGGASESSLAKTVREKVNHPRLKSSVGQTGFPQLMSMIAESKLFIGCDSGPAQIASLTQTPVLQLTSNASSFWTTGPTSAGSRILFAPELADIGASRISEEALALLANRGPQGPCVLRGSQLGEYMPHEIIFDDFSWNLIEALYTNTAYPDTDSEVDLLAFQRVFELAELALQQLNKWNDPAQQKTAALILKNIDEMLIEVARLNGAIAPLIDWFQTERLRIPPGEPTETLERTAKLFSDLHIITAVYRRYGQPQDEALNAVKLCRKCSQHLREYRLNIVQEDFQKLISTLHELSRHSTKVGGDGWHSVLTGLNEALDRRDLIEVADQLEYVLVPALSS